MQKLLPVQTTASNSPDTILKDLEKARISLGKKATFDDDAPRGFNRKSTSP
jgi:hypothetical protein